MATTLRRPNSRLSFADEVSYRDSPVTADLDNSFPENFIIGDRVWLNGIYGARIQYIGEVHFGSGDDWAGLVMDDYVGKHDGSVNGHRYYYCENKKGLFARLSKLTRVPLRAQESPDSGIQTNSNSPRPPIRNRQRHNSSPSPILKNSSNRNYSNTKTSQTTNKPEVTFKRNYSTTTNTPRDSSKDRSYEYYEYRENQNSSERNLNRSTESSEILNTSSRSSPFSLSSSYGRSPSSSLTSPNLLSYYYVRPSRSSTPKYPLSGRSLSTGSSRQPRIHHIKVELEPESLDFKRNLKKACSEDIVKDQPDKPQLKLGDLVYVDSSRGLLSGKLRFLGPTSFKEGHFAGVELDYPYGRHNGKVEGKRYFTCKNNHGLMVPCTKVFAQRRVDPSKQKSTRFADDV